jgi:hypothetical protein
MVSGYYVLQNATTGSLEEATESLEETTAHRKEAMDDRKEMRITEVLPGMA